MSGNHPQTDNRGSVQKMSETTGGPVLSMNRFPAPVGPGPPDEGSGYTPGLTGPLHIVTPSSFHMSPEPGLGIPEDESGSPVVEGHGLPPRCRLPRVCRGYPETPVRPSSVTLVVTVQVSTVLSRVP